MDLPSQTIIDVLRYLLPGFITAALVYALTPAPRPVPFERVIQALIYTIVIQVCVASTEYIALSVGRRVGTIGTWTADGALAWSVVFAVVFGLFFVWADNSDRLHGLLRRMRITHQTSYASEWYGAFCRHEGYVVLHMKGERRLLGWPEEWPSTPSVGHFVIAQAEWLGDDNRPMELAGVQRVLIRADDVEMVEMMRPIVDEESHGRSKGTDGTAESKSN